MESTEPTTKKPKRSIEAQLAAAQERTAALRERANVAMLRSTQHGKRLYGAKADLEWLVEAFAEEGARPFVRDALVAVNVAIGKCLEVVRGGERGGGA